MRYSKIHKLDVSNGSGIGVALFVQGCHFHCKNCFNKETWDFNKGKEWTPEIENEFLNLINRPYITRVTLLGGEPLETPHQIYLLINKIKDIREDIKIWIYSGFTYEEILLGRERTKAILNADILVDGRYIDELKDISLKFRGSSNQRIIDVKKSLMQGKVVLYME